MIMDHIIRTGDLVMFKQDDAKSRQIVSMYPKECDFDTVYEVGTVYDDKTIAVWNKTKTVQYGYSVNRFEKVGTTNMDNNSKPINNDIAFQQKAVAWYKNAFAAVAAAGGSGSIVTQIPDDIITVLIRNDIHLVYKGK